MSQSLIRRLLPLCRAPTWEQGRREWEWVRLEDLGRQRPGRCLCGVSIRWRFWLRNTFTEEEVGLGRECVQHLDRGPLRAARSWQDLRDEPHTVRMNEDLLQFLERRQIVSEADLRYYRRYRRTRVGVHPFVDRRLATINLEFLASQDPARPRCLCDPKRYRRHEAVLRGSPPRLFYRCRRGRRGCRFFQFFS